MINLSMALAKLRNFLVLLAISTSVSVAATPTVENHIWLRTPGGINEPICRKLWVDYDAIFHTNTIIVSTKYGLDGIIPLTELLASKEKNKFYCGGVSTVVTNPIIHKDLDTKAEQFVPLIQMVGTPLIWLTPNSNKATNYKEMIAYWKSLNRPINVGVYYGVGRMIANRLSELGVPVNLITYKNGAQAYPSLADGTLDLSLDGTTAIPVAESGKFKVMAYTWLDNLPQLNQYPNFAKSDPVLNHMRNGLVVAVPKTMSKQEQEIMTQRLKFVVQQPSYVNFIAETKQVPMAVVGNELKHMHDGELAQTKKYFK